MAQLAVIVNIVTIIIINVGMVKANFVLRVAREAVASSSGVRKLSIYLHKGDEDTGTVLSDYCWAYAIHLCHLRGTVSVV